jgi:hypothetical protein
MLNDEIAKKKNQMKNSLRQPRVNLSNLCLDSWYWDNHIKSKLKNQIKSMLNDEIAKKNSIKKKPNEKQPKAVPG